MKVLGFKSKINEGECNSIEERELYSLINKPSDSIILYDCLLGENGVEYKFRKASDNTLVAEFDRNLNMIGELRCLVDSVELEKALDKLKESKQALDEVNKMLGFDKIEEKFRKKVMM